MTVREGVSYMVGTEELDDLPDLVWVSCRLFCAGALTG